jgi:two-component sensor histidine kinase/HAMP domain-containing protein
MHKFDRLGIRGLFLFLLFVIIVPFSVTQVIHGFDDYKRTTGALYDDAHRTGQLTAAHVTEIVRSAQHFLTVLSYDHEVLSLDPARISMHLAQFRRSFPQYNNVGVNDGKLSVAGFIPQKAPVDSTGMPWYERLQNERRFVVGDYQVGRITKTHGINFACPLPNQGDAVPLKSVYLALDLSVLDAATKAVALPPWGTISIIDANGTILSRNPNPQVWVGKRSQFLPGSDLFKKALSSFVDIQGLDGVQRVFTVIPVNNTYDQLYVVIGYSKASIFFEQMRGSIIGLVVMSVLIILTLSIAVSLGRKRLIGPIVALYDAAKRLAKGDLTARAPHVSDAGEISELTESFNSMADSVQMSYELVKSSNKDLATQIAAKTRELTASNEELRKRNDEREMILKEVHHRIKNNMSTIASLLSIQAQTTANADVSAALTAAENRVVSMMVLYDKLYHAQDMTALAVGDYVSTLIDEIVVQFPGMSFVKIEKDLCSTQVDAKRLSLIGMFINELITNAMKYAFNGRTDGSITVRVAERFGQMSVSVSDDGPGTLKNTQTSAEGFGMELVRMVAAQLTGTLRTETSKGRTVTLAFPLYDS